MKKYLKFLVIILIICIAIYLFWNRTITISQDRYMKNIYKEDVSNINIYLRNVLGDKVGEIDDKNDIMEILNIIKNEQIKPVNIFEYDRINAGSAHKLTITSPSCECRITIGHDSVSINSKLYKIDNDLYGMLVGIISKYNDI